MSTITLKHPIEFKGTEIKTLEMRRPKVRDQVASKKTSESKEMVEVNLFANLCEVSPELIMGLDMKDYGSLQKEYKGFLS